MSDTISDGQTRVTWVPSIANINAPTVPELTGAGVLDLTVRLTPTGLKLEPKTADVDTSSMASVFNAAEAGRVSFDSPELTLKRGTTQAEDAAYTVLVRGVHGFLVIRRNVPYATAYASGQQVEAYPMVCGERSNMPPAANEVMKWVSPLKVTAQPATAAVIA